METSKPNQPLPPGACDCHTHVFLEQDRFPLWSGRRYTPPAASIASLQAFHDVLGIQRVVIVQPSVYGLDNSATLHALRVLGKSRARGVAVIDEHASDALLDELEAAGVCGIRVNLEIDREGDTGKASAHMQGIAERVASRGWHIQLYASLPLLAGCSEVIQALPTPVVLDHHACAMASGGLHQPGLARVLGLVESGKAYVKLSAPYRSSSQAGFADMEALARLFMQCNPDRMLWGSDWPHPQPGAVPSATEVCPPFVVDSGHMLNQLRQWAGDESIFRKMLVDNPGRLYAFCD